MRNKLIGMRNKLIGLIFVIASCLFLVNRKVNDALLLSHLKNIRIELISRQEYIWLQAFSRSQKEKEVDYFFVMFSELFYNRAEILQRVIKWEAQLVLDLICKYRLPLTNIIQRFDELPSYHRFHSITRLSDSLHGRWYPDFNEKMRQELFELFAPMFKRFYQHYFDKSDSSFGKVITDKKTKDSFEHLLKMIGQPANVLGQPLLALIDAKIAELEDGIFTSSLEIQITKHIKNLELQRLSAEFDKLLDAHRTKKLNTALVV